MPHSRLVGGAKALVPMTVELALSDVKTMKTKGAIQMTAITIRTSQSTTSTGSMRSDPAGRKAAAKPLIAVAFLAAVRSI